MNKKLLITVLLAAIVIIILSIVLMQRNRKTTINADKQNDTKTTINADEQNEINTNNTSKTTNQVKENDMNTIQIKVNDKILSVKLENNSSSKELVEKLKEGDIILEAHEYGGFEKVGNLGFSLSKDDKNITTEAGDIVLYQGNQISVFYNSNSWSYTRLGKIQNVTSSELKEILGSGDVSITFTLNDNI